MTFTVIIPSKTAANLFRCVSAVRSAEGSEPRILAVDDGLEMAPGDVELVAGEKPFVYARNCNLGIRAALTEPIDGVILLNDDALLESRGGFSLLASAAREHPEYGVIGAVSNVVGNRNQFRRKVGLRSDPRMVCFLCVYIPRTTLETVGLLDEEFTGYGYDDDSYCVRVRRAGLQIGIHDGCYVDHGSLRSTFRGDPRAPASLQHNAEVFRRKYGAGNADV